MTSKSRDSRRTAARDRDHAAGLNRWLLPVVGGGRLVSASSPAAGWVEIHEMAMDGDVMKMRAVSGLDLPAGKAVALKPGGFHIMLFDLKRALKAGDTVPLTLVIEGADKQRETLEIKARVRALGAAAEPKH